MRALCFLMSLLLFSQTLWAVGNTPAHDLDKKMDVFLKTLGSTNNIEVLLQMQRKQISTEAYSQLLKIVNSSSEKNKFFQIKKVSNRAFALKLKNSQWAPFKLNLEDGSLLIGKTSFKWNSKNSIQVNLDKISEIMTTEFGQSSKTAFNFVIPEAQAQSKTISHTSNDVVAIGLTASFSSSWGADLFLSRVDNFCSDKKGFMKSIGETKQVQVDFKAAKDIYTPKLGNVWGGTITHEAYAKFDRAQRCLEKHKYIRDVDFLPIAVEEGAKAENNGVSQ